MSEIFNNITPLFTWVDRRRAFHHLCKTKPSIPLILAFLIENRRDMDMKRWRKMRGLLDLPDEMAYGLLVSLGEPIRERLNWPPKKKEKVKVPAPFQQNDTYWRDIIENDWRVRNEVRILNDELPKWMKKTMEDDPWV